MIMTLVISSFLFVSLCLNFLNMLGYFDLKDKVEQLEITKNNLVTTLRELVSEKENNESKTAKKATKKPSTKS